MNKKITYKKGQKIGDCFYLREVEPYTRQSGRTERMAVFMCKCGNEFTSLIQSVKSGLTKSCGCFHKQRAKEVSTKHGLRDSIIYTAWNHMKRRCYEKTNPAYNNYGGRGITVCAAWMDFKTFYDYVMSLPNAMNPGLTIDRKRNDGNYESDNLRWTDRHNQCVNRRRFKSNTTGFNGVCPQRNKYKSDIGINGGKVYLGEFDTIIEAANARNNYIIKHGLWEYPIQNTLIA